MGDKSGAIAAVGNTLVPSCHGGSCATAAASRGVPAPGFPPSRFAAQRGGFAAESGGVRRTQTAAPHRFSAAVRCANLASVSSATEAELQGLIDRALSLGGQCLFLTGAGISAESGVPTFRGKEGYWVVGSRHYHPQELATRGAFARMPAAVWGWYLHRLRVCRGALPNSAHHALAELAPVLGERFLLITQNVDGPHARAGAPKERTYEVHGNISWMRCSRGCAGLVPVPEVPDELHERGAPPVELECSSCAAWMRPHVLWFDEFYDEELFRFESSLRAADSAALLVVVGTTGTTHLPLQIGQRAAHRGVPTLVINPEPNPFSELARGLPESAFLQGTAGHWVPRVAAHIRAALAPGQRAARV